MRSASVAATWDLYSYKLTLPESIVESQVSNPLPRPARALECQDEWGRIQRS
ncbi:hypothetical protein HanPSC8_Chr15g0660271 [Helianthus annuus]|nr:hypothetical protein HanPSC8_Chr15g0660271 [Helianthus annuus]